MAVPRAALLVAAALVQCACAASDGDRRAALVALDVTGAATALTPPFDPDVLRYSVILDASPEDVQLTAKAPPAYVVSVDDAITPSDTPRSLARDGPRAGDLRARPPASRRRCP